MSGIQPPAGLPPFPLPTDRYDPENEAAFRRAVKQAVDTLRASSITGLAASDIPNLDASKITTGVFNTACLGSGTANNTVFLRGDGTWTNTLLSQALTIKGPSNNGRLILDTTTGATSDFADILFERGGVIKWRIGLNESSTNVDSFEIWNEPNATWSFRLLDHKTMLLGGGSNEKHTIHFPREVAVGTTATTLTNADYGGGLFLIRDGTSPRISTALVLAEGSNSSLTIIAQLGAGTFVTTAPGASQIQLTVNAVNLVRVIQGTAGSTANGDLVRVMQISHF